MACCDRAREELGIVHHMPLVEAATLTKRRGQLTVREESPAWRSHSQRTSQPSSASNSSGTPRSPSPSGRLADPHFSEHEPERDQESLEQLAVWCEQFSPIVGLEQETPPSSLLLDITGLAPIFGGEPRLVDLITKAFAQRQYHVRIGIGDTVGAAWAIAHYGHASHYEQDLLDLPVEALRIEPATLDTLRQLGILTVAQLLQLPRKAVATRLGEALICRLDQLLGQHPEIIIAHRAAPEFEVEWLLEHPTNRRNAVEKILEHLSLQLARILSKHDHAVVQVEAVLHGSKHTRRLTVSLFEPTSNAQHLFDLLKLQSETVQFQEPLQRVQLIATATVRIQGGQQLLWDDLDAYTGRAQQREIGALVDRLSSRLGKESVFGICAQAGALPEKAYRPKLLSSTLKQRNSPTANTLKAPHRPLWLHDPPQPLRIQPTNSRDARHLPPTSFEFEQQLHRVLHHWGPERIETGWWRGRTVRRDYYRVETTNGSRFWLFRQLHDGAWFLHGCFE